MSMFWHSSTEIILNFPSHERVSVCQDPELKRKQMLKYWNFLKDGNVILFSQLCIENSTLKLKYILKNG